MCAESNENTDFRGKHIVQTKESIRYFVECMWKYDTK